MPYKGVAESFEQGNKMIRFVFFLKGTDGILEYGLEFLRIETRNKF